MIRAEEARRLAEVNQKNFITKTATDIVAKIEDKINFAIDEGKFEVRYYFTSEDSIAADKVAEIMSANGYDTNLYPDRGCLHILVKF